MNNLLRLLQLTDPTLPIGGFSHSAGLETYVQKGAVHDAKTAKEFVVQMLAQNIFYTDGALVSLAYDAAKKNDVDELIRLDGECTAVKLPKEIRQASQKLGLRLMKIFTGVLDHQLLHHFQQAIKQQKATGNYCIVFGLVAAVLQIEKEQALSGFYYNAAVGMVTNCVKLIPLGQQDGQQLLFSLHSMITSLAQKSMKPDVDLIGVCCTGFDVRSMQHETLYSRLYMS